MGKKNKNPMVGGRGEERKIVCGFRTESLAEKGGNVRGAGITFSGKAVFTRVIKGKKRQA